MSTKAILDKTTNKCKGELVKNEQRQNVTGISKVLHVNDDWHWVGCRGFCTRGKSCEIILKLFHKSMYKMIHKLTATNNYNIHKYVLHV